MKKFTVLAVLALMVAVVMPVMATDFTWSGELTYGSMNDFTNVIDAYGNAKISVAGKVDANNTINATISSNYSGAPVTVLTDLAGGTGTLNAFTAYISTFDMVTDIGKVFGLSGVTIVATYGWADPTATSYSVSAFGNESLIGYDPGTRDVAQLVFGFGAPASVQLAVAQIAHSTKAIKFDPHVLADIYGAFGPVSYSVAYSGKTDFKGTAGASVKFGQAFGDITPAVAASVSYNLAAPASKALQYGVGASFAYTTMVTVGVGLDGWDKPGLDALSVNASFVPMASLGIDVGAEFDLSGAATPKYGVDLSAWYLFGKSKARLGYLITNAAYGALNTPANLNDGGLYFSWDLSF
jgi:hypothetical protein